MTAGRSTDGSGEEVLNIPVTKLKYSPLILYPFDSFHRRIATARRYGLFDFTLYRIENFTVIKSS